MSRPDGPIGGVARTLVALAAVAGLGTAGYYTLSHAPEPAAAPAAAPESTDGADEVVETAAAPRSETARNGDLGSTRVGTESVRNYGPAAENPQLQFLVQFDGEEARRLASLFREDPSAAQSAFDEIAASNPAFRHLRLTRMSYGGRATLDYMGPEPRNAAAANQLSARIIEQLEAQSIVRYAEPNLASWN